jgi:hypothetical protein
MPRYAVLTTLEGPSGISNIIIADGIELTDELNNLRCIEIDATVGSHWHFDGEKFIESQEVTND